MIKKYFLIVALTTVLSGLQIVNSTQLHTYRLVLATTGEFGEQFSSIAEQKIFLSELVEKVNSVTVRDLGVQFVLIENDQLLHENPLTDPFTDGAFRFQLLTEGDLFISTTIDPSTYDIGHTIGYDLGGGVAYTAFPCSTADKSGGVTGVYFDVIDGRKIVDESSVNTLLHELGHQLGAGHTFNSTSGECGFMRNAQTAVEPGAGSTLMSYAENDCGDDLFSTMDQYFHATSITEIIEFRDRIDTSCLVVEDIGENTPIVDAGEDVVVPAQTPLFLQGEIGGADTSGNWTASWEQIDPGQGASLSDDDDGLNPLFRSIYPRRASYRILPQISDLLSGTVTNEERLPTVSRSMQFSLSARDSLGGPALDKLVIQVDSQAGPFAVRSPNSGETLSGTADVRWDVAGTDQNDVSAEFVDIFLLLNEDGAYDFGRPLKLRTPNDGAEVVQLPELNNSLARVLVKGSDNVFFNISPGPFSLNEGGEEICPASDIVEHYSTQWETGNLSDWSPSTDSGSRSWQVDSRNPMSGSFHVSIGNTSTQFVLIDARLTTNSALTIPANSVLEIRHAHNRIDRYSAGLLEWSSDGGVGWHSIEDTAPVMIGGYDAVSGVGTSSSITPDILSAFGKPAYGSTFQNGPADTALYQTTRFDLSALQGMEVLIRFRFLSNGGGEQFSAADDYGWDVDSLRVISCVSLPSVFIPNLSYYDLNSAFDVVWSENGTNVESWRLDIGTFEGASDVFSGSVNSGDSRLETVPAIGSIDMSTLYFTLTYLESSTGQTHSVSKTIDIVPSMVLPDGQWVQIGVPAIQTEMTVEEYFSGKLNSVSYGTDWVLYEYVQIQGSNTYRELELDSPMVANRGYWFLQRTGMDVVLELAGGSLGVANEINQDCPAQTTCSVEEFPISGTGPSWKMHANPYGFSADLDEMFIGTELNGTYERVGIEGQASGFTHSGGLFIYVPSANGGGSYSFVGSGTKISPMQAGWLGITLTGGSSPSTRAFAGFTVN